MGACGESCKAHGDLFAIKRLRLRNGHRRVRKLPAAEGIYPGNGMLPGREKRLQGWGDLLSPAPSTPLFRILHELQQIACAIYALLVEIANKCMLPRRSTTACVHMSERQWHGRLEGQHEKHPEDRERHACACMNKDAGRS